MLSRNARTCSTASSRYSFSFLILCDSNHTHPCRTPSSSLANTTLPAMLSASSRMFFFPLPYLKSFLTYFCAVKTFRSERSAPVSTGIGSRSKNLSWGIIYIIMYCQETRNGFICSSETIPYSMVNYRVGIPCPTMLWYDFCIRVDETRCVPFHILFISAARADLDAGFHQRNQNDIQLVHNDTPTPRYPKV